MHSQLYNDHFEFYTVLLYPIDTLNVVLSTLKGPQAPEIQRFASEEFTLFLFSHFIARALCDSLQNAEAPAFPSVYGVFTWISLKTYLSYKWKSI